MDCVRGKEPFNQSSAPIFVSGTCYWPDTSTAVQSNAANFTIPKNLVQNTVGSELGSGVDRCYQVHLSTYERNTFVTGSNAEQVIHDPREHIKNRLFILPLQYKWECHARNDLI